jgi:hypothetical protein
MWSIWAWVITMAFSQPVLFQNALHPRNIAAVARIDDNRFLRSFVAEYGAIALQHTYRQNLMDHKRIVR